MKSLVCQAGDCAHNIKGQCNANTIQVTNNTEETFCNTYVQEDKYLDKSYAKTDLNSMFQVEFGEEAFASPKITCNVAQCAYNKSFKCKANGVEINNPDGNEMCNCLTFRQK